MLINRVVLHKRRGETPLEAIKAWKVAHPTYKDTPAAYAGRLDPMAEGNLLVLLGEECKRQERYHRLDKEYEIRILLDVGSDTGDALGIVEYGGRDTRVDPRILTSALQTERGTHERAYPRYSSKTVEGKPLFLHTLMGNNVEVPTHTERIYSLSVTGTERIEGSELRAFVDSFLSDVPRSDEASKMLGADFRIDAVRQSWSDLFQEASKRSWVVLSLTVSCGAGTYMRTLAERIGEGLGTKAIAISINRTKIGRRFYGWWPISY